METDKDKDDIQRAPLPGFIHEQGEVVLLSIKLQPRASVNEIGQLIGDELKIKITAPPVDAAANKALLDLLAKKMNCAHNRIELVRGHRSHHKVVKLYNFSTEQVLRAILG